MKRKLKEELVKLSSDIIASRGLTEVTDLYEQARTLYEKLAVLKFIEEKLSDVEVDVSKSEVASKFESIASAVINENRQVPENNPHKEDIIIPGIDTIKHMVSEMPGGEELEEVLQRLIGKNEFVKNDAEEVSPRKEDLKKPVSAKSLNDTLTAKEIAVGLNDRLAFVKHLFDNNAEAFVQTMARLNTLESQENSRTYIEREVKPEFNHWEGKDEYASRFMALIERRFN
jgi:hypothetical protein